MSEIKLGQIKLDSRLMMKLLLDEQIPKSIAREFPSSIEIHTVQSQGWAGVTNGALITLAHENGFSALVSADKNIESQHNEQQLLVPVVILSVGTITRRQLDSTNTSSCF